MTPRSKRALTSAAAVALAGTLLYLALRGIEWRRVWAVLTGARPQFLAFTMGFIVVSNLLRSLRWRVLLNAQGRLAVGDVFWATMAGYLGNNTLPARAGELVRTLLISARSGLAKTYVLTTALTERIVDAIVLIGIGAVLLATQPKAPAWLSDSALGAVGVAAAAAVALGLLPRLAGPIARRLRRGTGLRARLADSVQQVALGVRALHHPTRLVGFVGLTAAIWTLDAAGSIVCAHALGLRMQWPAALLLLAGLGLGSAMPSTPGYVGIYQFVAVTVLVPFGFSRDEAVAYILAAQFLNFAVVGAFGTAGLLRARTLLAAGQRPGEPIAE